MNGFVRGGAEIEKGDEFGVSTWPAVDDDRVSKNGINCGMHCRGNAAGEAARAHVNKVSKASSVFVLGS